MIVIYLILLSRFSVGEAGLRPCVPNSQFLVDGKICNCNNKGQWNETDCPAAGQTNSCISGHVIWQGCNECVCQNGQHTCSRNKCTNESTSADKAVQRLRTVMPWCNPFRSYYINCNICVCPPSGKSAEAHCATDISCSPHREPLTSNISGQKNSCIPKVMYLFPCLHCLCTDDGYFVFEKCFETCTAKPSLEPTRKCIPKTFFRQRCNICKCPDNSIPDDTLCTKTVCNETTSLIPLTDLKNKSTGCVAHRFTKPKCFYCDCTAEGTINRKACLEQDCFKVTEFQTDISKEICSPGEVVPMCTECLCLRNGVTADDYCSTSCSYQSKLNVLEKVVEFENDKEIIDKKGITRSSGNDRCEPNAIYVDLGRFCLCPENGNTNFNLCTSGDDSVVSGTNKTVAKISIDFNMTCEPNTFIDFDCNTCFCSKKGKIDPKWCTYDDCESKRMIMKSHETQNMVTPDLEINDTCIPGSIFQVECNFCICPESGYVEKRVCTKNDCASLGKIINSDKFVCEPLAYYEVDCNVCYCPRDGLKNVARCTKNHCEKSFLRSDVCVPGQLFSEECNVCVCPPNGNKAERACTNNTCADSAPWKKIFQLSETLISNQIPEDATRNLDLCFPGEEFQVGCKLCSCPDMGLRSYASCSTILCDDDDDKKQSQPVYPQSSPLPLPSHPVTGNQTDRNTVDITNVVKIGDHVAVTRRKEFCLTYTLNGTEEEQCNPGSMYIIFCKECICPYMGDVNLFCRPLPNDFYCEQPYENHYYLPYARRNNENSTTKTHFINTTIANQNPTPTTKKPKIVIPKDFQHDHTIYKCTKPGRVMDKCYICDCEESGSLIEEHCFKNEDISCKDVQPSFLNTTLI